MTSSRRLQRITHAVSASGAGGIGTPPPIVGLTSTSYTEDTTSLQLNPDRGFMHFTESHYYSDNTGYAPLTSSDLDWAKNTNRHTLVFRIWYLEKFLAQDTIDQSFLNAMTADFNLCRSKGMKLIIRFSYSSNPNNTYAPPYNADPPFTRLMQHVSQLMTILTPNSDIIYALCAGFIGYWGEWYYTDNYCQNPTNPSVLSSTNLAQRRQLVETLVDGVSNVGTWVLLRNPPLRSLWYGSDVASNYARRVGLHNDCILGGVDDMGTYTVFSTKTVAAERSYTANLSDYIPHGGETCSVESPYSDWPNASNELALMNFSFLNAAYNTDVLNSWGATNLDTVKRKLGYRLVATTSRMHTSVSRGQSLRIELDLRNDGYARPTYDRDIIVRLDGPAPFTFRLPASSAFQLTPGSHTIWADIPIDATTTPGNYDVSLWLPDRSSSLSTNANYSIRLTNTGLWQAGGYNRLGTVIVL